MFLKMTKVMLIDSKQIHDVHSQVNYYNRLGRKYFEDYFWLQ